MTLQDEATNASNKNGNNSLMESGNDLTVETPSNKTKDEANPTLEQTRQQDTSTPIERTSMEMTTKDVERALAILEQQSGDKQKGLSSHEAIEPPTNNKATIAGPNPTVAEEPKSKKKKGMHRTKSGTTKAEAATTAAVESRSVEGLENGKQQQHHDASSSHPVAAAGLESSNNPETKLKKKKKKSTADKVHKIAKDSLEMADGDATTNQNDVPNIKRIKGKKKKPRIDLSVETDAFESKAIGGKDSQTKDANSEEEDVPVKVRRKKKKPKEGSAAGPPTTTDGKKSKKPKKKKSNLSTEPSTVSTEEAQLTTSAQPLVADTTNCGALSPSPVVEKTQQFELEDIESAVCIDSPRDSTRGTTANDGVANPISTSLESSPANYSLLESNSIPRGSMEPNEQAAKLESIPTSIPPKPCLERERDYQNIVLLSTHNNNVNVSDGPILEQAKQTRKMEATTNATTTVRDAPLDLLSTQNEAAPEQRPPEMDALLLPNGEDPIQDPEVLVEQYQSLQRLEQRKHQRKKCIVVGCLFLVGVGILATIQTFVFGWNNDDGGYKGPPTMAPTLGPFSLPPGLSEETILAVETKPSSPQFRAYDWLSRDPQRDSYPEWRLVQRFAVATLVFALRQGTDEIDLSNMFTDHDPWLVYDQSECDWGHTQSENEDSSVCNSKGRIQNFDLSSVAGVESNLPTSIPQEISLLSNLERLSISDNSVFVSFGDLLPTSIEQLNIRVLDVSQNKLIHQLEPTSPLFSLSNLEAFNASGNHLTGSVPAEITTMQQLNQFDLSRNRLTGTIPPEIAWLDKLGYLSLADNQVGGKIPTTLGSMKSLRWLHLGKTSLTGTIPTYLGMLSNSLVSLDMSRTLVSGRIPSEIAQLGGKLGHLDLSSNALSGPVPKEVGSLTSLQRLTLSLSALSGSMPSEIGGMLSLEEMDISNTLLEGALPTQIGLMTKLKHLQVSGNSHTGSIVSEIGLLHRTLQWLDLSKNTLSNHIPSEIGRLSSLTRLDLSFNSFTGAIPWNVFRLTALQHVDLSNNFMSGQLQIDSVKDLESLRVLRLGVNYLSGPLPTIFGLMTSLVELDLSSTAITGTIPSEMGMLTKLEILKLSSNFLFGSIPTEFASMISLRHLEIYGTNVTGAFPVGFCDLPSLDVVSVNCEKIQCENCDCDCQP